ncbi:MAG: hypothetical protein QXO98_03720 [Sulfolobales archaeon]
MDGGIDLKGVIDSLERYLSVKDEEFIAYHLCKSKYNPFEVLVSIILSQNTRDDLALVAFNNLRNKLGVITPRSILSHTINEIEDTLRIAGLYRRKAQVLTSLARSIENLGGVDVLKLLSPEELRKILLDIDGIGYKTVDVFMLMCRGRDVFPIDTHIRRVLSRLGIINRGEHYLKIQEKIHKTLPPSYYLKAHLLLIGLGRKFCRARKPLCNKCFIATLCPKII